MCPHSMHPTIRAWGGGIKCAFSNLQILGNFNNARIVDTIRITQPWLKNDICKRSGYFFSGLKMGLGDSSRCHFSTWASLSLMSVRCGTCMVNSYDE